VAVFDAGVGERSVVLTAFIKRAITFIFVHGFTILLTCATHTACTFHYLSSFLFIEDLVEHVTEGLNWNRRLGVESVLSRVLYRCLVILLVQGRFPLLGQPLFPDLSSRL